MVFVVAIAERLSIAAFSQRSVVLGPLLILFCALLRLFSNRSPHGDRDAIFPWFALDERELGADRRIADGNEFSKKYR